MEAYPRVLVFSVVDDDPCIDCGRQNQPCQIGDEKPTGDSINSPVDVDHHDDEDVEDGDVGKCPWRLMKSEEEEGPQDVEDKLDGIELKGRASDLAMTRDTPGRDGEQCEEEGPDRREEPAGGLKGRLPEQPAQYPAAA